MRRIGYILLGAIGLAVFAPPIIERVPAFQNAVTVSAKFGHDSGEWLLS